ncbi:MAG: PP2C family protein-serine/threonine phosphatase, partial [Acidobacteriota bacterium]
YIDFIPQPNGCLCIAIGDVSGHGFGAALVMAETRAYLRAYASMDSDAGVLLGHVNRALSADLDGGKYVTLLLVRLDPRKRSLQYAGAGHIPGYLLGAAGEVRHLVESAGSPLGLFPDQQYCSGPEVPVEDGETLVLLTDGITETRSVSGHEFGAARVLEYLKCHPRTGASELIQSIHQAARAFAGGQDQADDASLIVARVGPKVTAR